MFDKYKMKPHFWGFGEQNYFDKNQLDLMKDTKEPLRWYDELLRNRTLWQAPDGSIIEYSRMNKHAPRGIIVAFGEFSSSLTVDFLKRQGTSAPIRVARLQQAFPDYEVLILNPFGDGESRSSQPTFTPLQTSIGPCFDILETIVREKPRPITISGISQGGVMALLLSDEIRRRKDSGVSEHIVQLQIFDAPGLQGSQSPLTLIQAFLREYKYVLPNALGYEPDPLYYEGKGDRLIQTLRESVEYQAHFLRYFMFGGGWQKTFEMAHLDTGALLARIARHTQVSTDIVIGKQSQLSGPSAVERLRMMNLPNTRVWEPDNGHAVVGHLSALAQAMRFFIQADRLPASQ